MYKVWIENKDGSKIEWVGLTEQQAVRLYNLTQKHIDWTVDCPIERFGWGKME